MQWGEENYNDNRISNISKNTIENNNIFFYKKNKELSTENDFRDWVEEEILPEFAAKFLKIAQFYGFSESEKRIGEKILYYLKKNIGVTGKNDYAIVREGMVWVGQSVTEFQKNVRKDSKDKTKRFGRTIIERSTASLCNPEFGLFIRERILCDEWKVRFGNVKARENKYFFSLNLENVIRAIEELGGYCSEKKLDDIESMSNALKTGILPKSMIISEGASEGAVPPYTPDETRGSDTSLYVYDSNDNKSREHGKFYFNSIDSTNEYLKLANLNGNSSSGHLIGHSEFPSIELNQRESVLEKDLGSIVEEKSELIIPCSGKKGVSEQRCKKSKEDISLWMESKVEELKRGDIHPWQLLKIGYSYVNDVRCLFVDPKMVNGYIKYAFCRGSENWQLSSSWLPKLVDWLFSVQMNGKTFEENMTFIKHVKKPNISGDRGWFSCDTAVFDKSKESNKTKDCDAIMNYFKNRHKLQPEIYGILEKVLLFNGEGFMISWMNSDILSNIVMNQDEKKVVFLFKHRFFKDWVSTHVEPKCFEGYDVRFEEVQ